LTVYAGRFVDQIADVGLSEDYSVLGERDILPRRKLTTILDHASTLVLLDAFSFPFGDIDDGSWEVPMVVVLPSGSDVESMTADLGKILFERLGFFDRIASPDYALWKSLCHRYSWAECQYFSVTGTWPGEAISGVCALLDAEFTAANNLNNDQHEAVHRCEEHDHEPATSTSCWAAPPRVHGGLRFNKALHAVQAAVLEPQLAAVQGKVPFDVLEVGVGAGRWASSFDLTKTRFVGADISEDTVGAARANFPDQHFDLLGSDLLLPYNDESFDLVFSVTFMHNHPTPARRTLLSEMWRVTRPGGRLVLLEDFAVEEQSSRMSRFPLSVLGLLDLLIDATAEQAMLEYVESLRYPHEDMFRSGLISLSKPGTLESQRFSAVREEQCYGRKDRSAD